MSAVERMPATLNFLSPLNYQFYIKRCKNLNFYVQRIAFPDISLASVPVPNPNVDFKITGDHLNYGVLTVTFKIDEMMANYLEIWNWIRGIAFPNTSSEHAELEYRKIITGEGLTSEITVLILDSNQLPKLEFTFTDGFPIQLSGFSVQSTDNEVNFLTAEAMFAFTNYYIKAI